MPYADRAVQAAYQREWCAGRRAESLEGIVCEACGSDEELEWHHLDPAEKVTHSIWSFAPARRASELAKCIPLCSPCHKAVTARQRRADAVARNPHGTVGRYWIGCRCHPCRVARNAYERDLKSADASAASQPEGAPPCVT